MGICNTGLLLCFTNSTSVHLFGATFQAWSKGRFQLQMDSRIHRDSVCYLDVTAPCLSSGEKARKWPREMSTGQLQLKSECSALDGTSVSHPSLFLDSGIIAEEGQG